jgi:hypothetical protein
MGGRVSTVLNTMSPTFHVALLPNGGGVADVVRVVAVDAPPVGPSVTKSIDPQEAASRVPSTPNERHASEMVATLRRPTRPA